MNRDTVGTPDLPIKGNGRLAAAMSLAIAALVAVASAAGLLYHATIYPTDELLQSFVPNDVVNLVIGLPILLGSIWLVRRGKISGLLLWPGALFYVFYTYLVYVLSMPFNLAFLSHLALVTLSAYTTIGLVASIDGKEVQRRLAGRVPERAAGAVLAGLGILLFVRVAAVMVNALISRTPIAGAELALHATDFIVAPAWVIGGVLLWRRETLGYVTGLGLLFQASMLFVGLIFVLIVRPFLTEAEFVLSDVLVVLVMGMVCFVPFALFLRGAASRREASSPRL